MEDVTSVRDGQEETASVEATASVLRGDPLDNEEGIGALTLGGYLEAIAARFGDREALVIDRGGCKERWTYSDLLARSLDVARALRATGLAKGERVGILQTNTPEFLASLFGTAMAGGVAMTISTFFTAAELEAVLKLGGCSVLLAERHVLKKDFVAMLDDLDPAMRRSQAGQIASPLFPFLRRVVVIGGEADGGFESWESFIARGRGVPADLVAATSASVSPSDPAVLFFSSGSTGKPKGILSAHRAVCLQLWRWPEWYRIAEPPRTWAANGFFWSGNFAMALGGTLSTGGTIVLQRWFDADEVLALMESERVTMLIAWPHQWAQLVDSPRYHAADLSALRYVDETSPIGQHPTVRTTWRQPANSYGSTETFTLISVHTRKSAGDSHPASHGVPTAGSTIRICDPMTGEVVPRGERGEIAVKGPTLMLGYLGCPLDETLDADGFFRTGDGGYVDANGHLVWEGRLNDIIKTGGANVSPLEIDEVIRTHPEVKVVQTVGVPDELLGELVVSCVVPFEGAAIDEDAVKAFARERLASYKVPRRVLFVTDEDLNLTGSAKVRLSDLRDLAAARLR